MRSPVGDGQIRRQVGLKRAGDQSPHSGVRDRKAVQQADADILPDQIAQECVLAGFDHNVGGRIEGRENPPEPIGYVGRPSSPPEDRPA